MTDTPVLGSVVHYSGHVGAASWEGRSVTDATRFKRFAREVIRPRLADAESSFESDLQGMATTGMATEYVERLLKAVPEPTDWEVGEALAECALRSDWGREVHWPWNTVRDRRTPRASLPGADLVGFCRHDEKVTLLFGEVKTSTDRATPPNVMYGGSGMTWQLEQSAIRMDIQHTLLKWLHARCGTDRYHNFYKQAVGHYLRSEGKDLLLVGVLIRDTNPDERDLKNRAEALSHRLASPTRIDLIAWYLPVPIADWGNLFQEEAS